MKGGGRQRCLNKRDGGYRRLDWINEEGCPWRGVGLQKLSKNRRVLKLPRGNNMVLGGGSTSTKRSALNRIRNRGERKNRNMSSLRNGSAEAAGVSGLCPGKDGL